jgi:predicted ATPase
VANYSQLKRFYVDGRSNKIYLVCLTGGPCAGKTTALMNITEKFSGFYKVFAVPELATAVINGGVNLVPVEKSMEDRKELTRAFVKQVMALEDYFIEAAKLEDKDCLIVCDRGVMDSKAWLPGTTAFDEILVEENLTENQVTNERYDLVCHMVTAAEGAEHNYTTKNNTARKEKPEDARALDKKIQEVWINHHNFRILSATPTFDKKLDNIVSVVNNLLNTKASYNLSQKYLLPMNFSVDTLPRDLPSTSFTEEMTYLIASDCKRETSFLKKRSYSGQGAEVYSHTVRHFSGGQTYKRTEEKCEISVSIYD